jgi:hypothetical protein
MNNEYGKNVEVNEDNFDWNYDKLRMTSFHPKAGHDPVDGIRNIFNDECKTLAIDVGLLKRIRLYQVNFVNRNQDHAEFFGSNLTGVHVVRFLPSDRDRWFDEIIEVNDGPLGERLVALPDVNEKWFISSDTFNLSCVWLAHTIYNNKKLSDQQKHDGMLDIFLILQYKYLTSILFHWFRYPADRATAEATYAQLTYKFAIKQYGSWIALLTARAEELISKTSIHYNTIRNMHDDKEVVYMLNDTQGRIKDIMKNIYAVFERVHNSGARIRTTSSVSIDHEGEEILKDRTHHLMIYTRYINTVVSDKNSFIKGELTDIIESLLQTMPGKLFLNTLDWMSNNYRQTGASEIEEVLNGMLIYTFSFIAENKELIRKESDLAILLSKLKGSIMSSRSTDEELMNLRDKTEIIVKKATQNHNESVIAATRTGVLLYVVLRSLTMKHYG